MPPRRAAAFFRALNRPLLLERLQWLFLALIPLLAAHTYRSVLWSEDVPGAEVYVEFRAVAIFLVHYPLAALLLTSAARLLADRAYRPALWETARRVFVQYGGVVWLALVVWMGATLLWARYDGLTLYQTAQSGAALILAVVLADSVRRSHSREKRLLLAFGLGAVFQAALGLMQILFGGPLGVEWLGELQWETGKLFNFEEQTFRAYALTVHPNNLAGYLFVGLFACSLLAYYEQRRPYKMLYIAAGLLVVLGLVVTISRAALLAAAVSAPLALTALVPVRRIRLKRGVVIALALLALGFGAALLAGAAEDIAGRFLNLAQNPRYLWARVFYAFEDTTAVIQGSPVLGVGSGNLMLEIGERRAGSNALLLPAHNVYVMLWAELGIPGAALFAAACASVLARLRYGNGTAAFVWGCCFLGLCIIMAFDYYWWGDLRSQTLLFWVLGMWWGCSFYHDEYSPV